MFHCVLEAVIEGLAFVRKFLAELKWFLIYYE